MNILPENIRLIALNHLEGREILTLKITNCRSGQIQEIRSAFHGEIFLRQASDGGAVLSATLDELEILIRKLQGPELNGLRNDFHQISNNLQNRNSLVWICREKKLQVHGATKIMAVLNVTPDSFSDGGDFFDTASAVERASQMVAAGADLIDIGGESTRPGAKAVSLQEELARILPVIANLANQFDVPISVDTYKSEVAEAAVQAGADIINDISGGRFDPEIFAIAAKYHTGLVLMHIKGTPQTMQQNPSYENVVEEILRYLSASVELALAKGIQAEQIVIDPGIGFGKRWFDNYDLINRLTEFTILGLPVLVGASRKSFLGKFLSPDPKQRLEGSLVANTMAIQNGANLIRVHDVAEIKKTARIADIFKHRLLRIQPEIIEERFRA